jgi:TRAP transporter TAXI family solute receptor
MKKSNLGIILCAFILALSIVLLPAVSQCAPKTYRVEMRATQFGGIIYVLGFGACDLLNKNSDWIRGSVLESTGSAENIKIVGKDPKKKERTFFMMAAFDQEEAIAGHPPYDDTPELYKDVKQIMAVTRMGGAMVVADPNIKTLSDLKGKRVSTWPKTTTKFRDVYSFIAGAGKDVVDSIKWQYTQFDGYDDLLIGKTDAIMGFWPAAAPGKYIPIPKLREIMTRSKKLRVIGATPAERARTKEMFGPTYGATDLMPANGLGPGFPDKDVLFFVNTGGWGAYPELPIDVVYEMLSIWEKNAAKFKEYHAIGASIVPADWGLLPISKDMWHPGAIKFFEEKGIKYGKEYYDQVEKELMEKIK